LLLLLNKVVSALSLTSFFSNENIIFHFNDSADIIKISNA